MRLPLILLLSVAWIPARAESGLTVAPKRIEMGAFYSGAQVRVEGTVQSGSKVVLVVRGADVEEVFNRKGRAGPIWVNAGKVRISGVPSLFLCLSQEPLERFLSREAIDRHQLDFEAIRKQMRIAPRQESPDLIRTNYLALKTDEGRYRAVSNAVTSGAPGATGVPFTAVIPWSKKITPATYEIRVYECRDGAVVSERTAPLEVVEIGFPAFMSGLSRNHSGIYGLFAVLVAMMAGFGIDFLAARLSGKRSPRADKHAPEPSAAAVEETHSQTKSTA